MVNYCSVKSCGKNSRVNNHLIFYSLPKDKKRMEEWLTAIRREDLIKSQERSMMSVRICSLHFPPNKISKNKLEPGAVPCLNLRGNIQNVNNVSVPEMFCDTCNFKIKGSYYTCLDCKDLTICQNCEVANIHSEHYMLRISLALGNRDHSTLKRHISKFIKRNHQIKDKIDESNYSSDDEPIIKYSKSSDDVIDLPETEKYKIRSEVLRVLKLEENIEVNEQLIVKPNVPGKTFKEISTNVTDDDFKSNEEKECALSSDNNDESDHREIDDDDDDDIDDDDDDEEQDEEYESGDNRPREMEFANVDNDEVKVEVQSITKDDLVDKLNDELSEFLLKTPSSYM